MLEINNLSKRYGNKVAVDAISFTVSQGEVFGLLGRNGAGKTTTIKMMLGLVSADAGSVQWNYQKGLKNVSFGYLPEERGLYPKVKVVDQLTYFAKLEGMSKSEIKKSVDYWIERFDIGEYRNKLAGDLSKGNQQKVQLIATLLHNPKLIILDEPFSGLDPVNVNILTDVIIEERQKGKVIIMSSHQMDQVEKFCKNVILMRGGQSVISGDLSSVKDSYGMMNMAITGDTRNLVSFFSSKNLPYQQEEKRVILTLPKKENPLQILEQLKQDGIEVNEFTYLQPSLHQIFIDKVGS